MSITDHLDNLWLRTHWTGVGVAIWTVIKSLFLLSPLMADDRNTKQKIVILAIKKCVLPVTWMSGACAAHVNQQLRTNVSFTLHCQGPALWNTQNIFVLSAFTYHNVISEVMQKAHKGGYQLDKSTQSLSVNQSTSTESYLIGHKHRWHWWSIWSTAGRAADLRKIKLQH